MAQIDRKLWSTAKAKELRDVLMAAGNPASATEQAPTSEKETRECYAYEATKAGKKIFGGPENPQEPAGSLQKNSRRVN